MDMIKGLIFPMMVLILGLASLQAQVDTEELFKRERLQFNEYNDCTVRAYAILTGKDYSEARQMVNESLGRKTGKGIEGMVFAKYIIKQHSKQLVTGYNYKEFRGRTAPQKDFIKTRAKAGNIYIVFTHGHVFVVKQDESTGKWLSFGNRGDNKRDVIAYIELKQ